MLAVSKKDFHAFLRLAPKLADKFGVVLGVLEHTERCRLWPSYIKKIALRRLSWWGGRNHPYAQGKCELGKQLSLLGK